MALTRINNQALTNVTSAGLPSGTVLQVKQGWSDNKQKTNTTANGAAPTCPASVTITPSSTNSKILIMFYGSWIFGNSNDVSFYLLRDSTQIGTSTVTGHNSRGIIVECMPSSSYSDHKPRSSSFQYLDSPSTTSAVTYTVKAIGVQGTKSSGGAAVGGNGNNEEWVWGGSIGTTGTESNAGTMGMIAMEIAG